MQGGGGGARTRVSLLLRGPPLGSLGRQARLAQLSLAVAALSTLLSGDSGVFARFLVPAAALQCTWSAVAAIVDVDWSQLRRTGMFSWTLWAYLALDLLTCMVTFTAASAAFGHGYHIAVDRCTAEPVRCPVIMRAWPKAVLAWVVLQPGEFYFAVVELWALKAFTIR